MIFNFFLNSNVVSLNGNTGIVSTTSLWLINFIYFLDNFRHIIAACRNSNFDRSFSFISFDNINIVKSEYLNEFSAFNNYYLYKNMSFKINRNEIIDL